MTLVALLIACVAVSSASQGWAMGWPAPRSAPYAVAWIASSGAQIAAYGFLFDALRRPLPPDMLAVMATTSMAVPAAAFWVGARRARIPGDEPFLGRIFAVLPIHLGIMLGGSVAGWVLLTFVWLRHIH